jgi:hypothetical protein
LKFKIDPAATSFQINFRAEMNPYPSTPTGNFLVEALSPSGTGSATLLWRITASSPTTFGLNLTRNSNNGNFPSFSSWGLDNMLAPDGSLRFVLNGAFLASIDHPGRVTTYLYDVSASYVIPEPTGALGLLAIGGMWSRRR